MHNFTSRPHKCVVVAHVPPLLQPLGPVFNQDFSFGTQIGREFTQRHKFGFGLGAGHCCRSLAGACFRSRSSRALSRMLNQVRFDLALPEALTPQRTYRITILGGVLSLEFEGWGGSEGRCEGLSMVVSWRRRSAEDRSPGEALPRRVYRWNWWLDVHRHLPPPFHHRTSTSVNVEMSRRQTLQPSTLHLTSARIKDSLRLPSTFHLSPRREESASSVNFTPILD
jgi:hypothetical protein